MIKKIEEQGDLEHIGEGTILTKYPVSGDFTIQVDFNDHANLMHYEVHSFNREMQLIQLKIPVSDISDAGVLIGTMRVGGVDESPPLLNKAFEDLITDKIWWYEAD